MLRKIKVSIGQEGTGVLTIGKKRSHLINLEEALRIRRAANFLVKNLLARSHKDPRQIAGLMNFYEPESKTIPAQLQEIEKT